MLHILFGSGVGGLESRSIDLVEELQNRVGGQGVLLLSPGPGPVVDRVGAIPGVSLFTHPYSGKMDLTRAVKSICERESVGSVLIYMFGLHVWAAAGAKRGGARNIFTCVGNPAPGGGVALVKNAVLAQVGRVFEDGEVACSDYVRKTMRSRYRLPPSRIHTIPNWCRTERFRDVASAGKTETGLIGMVARLDGIKDHPTLIRAFSSVKADLPGVRLALAGDGSERQALEDLASGLDVDGSVEFMGVVTDIPSFLGRLQVFAFSTTADEGFGIALAEALATGLPIVASDVGPVSEVVGDAALLVPPGDPAALAAALSRVLSDDVLRNELGDRALARAPVYDVSRAADTFLSLLGAKASGRSQAG